MATLPDPSLFLDRARAHMRAWAKQELGCDPADAVSVTLPSDRAAIGENFFDRDVLSAVVERFPNTLAGRMGRSSRAGDALCSAHAPFNLFAPLRSGYKSGMAARVLAEIVGATIDEIESVAFEQPSRRRNNPLGDNTAFDCLISGRSGGARISAGIEVKFTEGPYAWGGLERRRMLDPSSAYNRATALGGYFRPGAAAQLRTREFKQLWRNMLLAQLLSGPSHSCYYVHLYPRQNVYQAAVAAEFTQLLLPAGRSRYRPMAYEDYIALLATAGFDTKWVSYLSRRYLMAAG